MRPDLQKTLNKKSLKEEKQKMTSYDTSKEETSTPQRVREENEPEAMQGRIKKAKGK
jgi:hypothetical protein